MFLSKLGIILAMIAAAGAVPASTEATNGTIAGYGMEVLKWEVEIVPGRDEVFSGTVEEVIAQAIAMEPSFVTTLVETANNDNHRRRRLHKFSGRPPGVQQGLQLATRIPQSHQGGHPVPALSQEPTAPWSRFR